MKLYRRTREVPTESFERMTSDVVADNGLVKMTYHRAKDAVVSKYERVRDVAETAVYKVNDAFLNVFGNSDMQLVPVTGYGGYRSGSYNAREDPFIQPVYMGSSSGKGTRHGKNWGNGNRGGDNTPSRDIEKRNVALEETKDRKTARDAARKIPDDVRKKFAAHNRVKKRRW